MAINIHIENLHIRPESVGPVLEDLDRGVDPSVLEDLGYTGVSQQEAVLDDAKAKADHNEEFLQDHLEMLAARHEEADIAANARRNHLRNVLSHASPARRLEGFQTNHENRPRLPKSVDTKQYRETVMASESLQRACGSCALSETCRIKGNLSKWLDIHPYQKDTPSTRNKRRPGSSNVANVESRDAFGERLDANPLAHCIPKKADLKN